MSLQDFFQDTYSIIVTDFLIQNLDMEYMAFELADFLNINLITMTVILDELEKNWIVQSNENKYSLCRNEITESLISAVYAHSFKSAEEPEREEQ